MFCVDESNKSVYYSRASTKTIYKIANIVSGTFATTNTGLIDNAYSQFLGYDNYIYEAFTSVFDYASITSTTWLSKQYTTAFVT